MNLIPLLSDGSFSKRSIAEHRAALVTALREKFGLTVNTTGTGADMRILEAALILPLSEIEATLEDIFAQVFAESARGDNLDKILEPIGYPREVATRATGFVNVTLNDILDPGSEPDPYFPNGSLTFVDGDGFRYDQMADAILDGEQFASAETGVNSQTINATRTAIAHRFVLAEDETIGHFRVVADHVSGTPTFNVSIRADDGGNPDVLQVEDRLLLTGFQPANGTVTEGHFPEAVFLEAGTYWIVFERTAGEATFDGGAGGTADQVKSYNAAVWGLEPNVENLNLSIHGDIKIPVRARDLGALRNIPSGSITNVEFANATVSARWAANVETFGNHAGFEGGQNREPDAIYFERARSQLSSRENASLDGIIAAVQAVGGTTNVSGIENTTDEGGTQNTVFDTNQTGTESATTLNGTGDKFSQRVVITEEQYVQHFTAKLFTDTALHTTVRLETDSAGLPSGALVDNRFEIEDFDFDGTNLTSGTFNEGALLPVGTYWLVFEWFSGSGTFDGGTGGTANQAKGDTGGGYADDANIENANVTVVGGLRPHSARIFVTGGVDADIQEAIDESRSAGIYVEYLRPDPSEVVLSVTVEVDADIFTGDEDTLRNIIVDYIGGTKTNGDSANGLSVQQNLIRNEVISRLLDDDLVIGAMDVTTLRLGRKADFPTPGDLTSAEVVNLNAAVDERFEVEDPATDIDVTIVEV